MNNYKIDNSQIFVSLYLFILIFFVILNSVNKTSNNKFKKHAKEIENVFGNKKTQEGEDPNKKRLRHINVVKDLFSNDLRKIIDEDFTITDLDLYDKSNFFKMEISETSIFDENNHTLKLDKIEIFKKISKLIVNNQPKILMEILFDSDNTSNNLVYHRIENLKKIFSIESLDDKFLDIGISKKDSKLIIISFYLDDTNIKNTELTPYILTHP